MGPKEVSAACFFENADLFFERWDFVSYPLARSEEFGRMADPVVLLYTGTQLINSRAQRCS